MAAAGKKSTNTAVLEPTPPGDLLQGNSICWLHKNKLNGHLENKETYRCSTAEEKKKWEKLK